MLLTEMTLLVRAYKDELSAEKAKAQHAALMAHKSGGPGGGGRRSGKTSNASTARSSRSGHSSSRPHSSKPSSIASSRLSALPGAKQRSKQRPHTANPVPGARGGGFGSRLQPSAASLAAAAAEREWELEREREEQRMMMSLRQIAAPPVKVTTKHVAKVTELSSSQRVHIPGAARRPGTRGGDGGHAASPSKAKKKARPTTAPLQRNSSAPDSFGGASKGSSVLRRHRGDGGSKSAVRKTKKKQLGGPGRGPADVAAGGRSVLRQGMSQPQLHGHGGGDGDGDGTALPYMPSALIRTSLRDGFVHSTSELMGPDGIGLPEPLVFMPKAAPAAAGGGGGGGPRIQFGAGFGRA